MSAPAICKIPSKRRIYWDFIVPLGFRPDRGPVRGGGLASFEQQIPSSRLAGNLLARAGISLPSGRGLLGGALPSEF
jgi:hypothetical protein